MRTLLVLVAGALTSYASYADESKELALLKLSEPTLRVFNEPEKQSVFLEWESAGEHIEYFLQELREESGGEWRWVTVLENIVAPQGETFQVWSKYTHAPKGYTSLVRVGYKRR